jgi:valyl-tRNA synthetase
MQAVELEKAYNPKAFEDRIYALWKERGAFKPKAPGGDTPPYVIVIPPPNVTGVLHLGHGLNISLQDMAIRFHRMRGEAALWIPGTDHAGIATQNVVEKRLKAQGKNRRGLGREQFVRETWKVKEEHQAIISRQLARMGASVDWDRERFTLDEGLSKAVREVFVTLYERDLLYKGNYLVNWCTSCGTALSDDEVEHHDTPGKLYHIRYPLEGGPETVEIATTRPETLLGDTAVAAHPDDERYQALLGRFALLPLTNRRIPLVADAFVDREFGTGAVKITPAHDTHDWEAAERHRLPAINILTPEGRLNSEVPAKYRGMSVLEAREAVLEDLKAGGYYSKETAITHAVGRCYRCQTIIEPFLSEQWYVRMKPLAEKALAAWRRGEVIFYPKRWENTYQRWLDSIRDWCVSRQLWWGHQIPAWYCGGCGATSVSRVDLKVCPRCGCGDIKQDQDVLDTWFSSWLWPFSVLGWPGAPPPDAKAGGPPREAPAADFSRYYPTSALVTAYDIIFFWVARMIMAGLEFTGKAPFRDIYIHGLIRDKQGRKMSKTLGNGLDPLELVDDFGADALKFTLAFLCAQGQDILVDRESFKLGSKFANKIWNAGRYILMNLEGRQRTPNPAPRPADRWIMSRLNSAAKAMTGAFLSYRYNDAARIAYEYFWNDFCDWYVEASKLSLKGAESAGEKDRATTVLLEVLEESLRLLHPLLPFVTEELYGKLPPEFKKHPLLITAPYPVYAEGREDREAEENFSFIQELVRMVRTLRSECTISPDKKLRLLVNLSPEREAFFQENVLLVKLLAGIGELEIQERGITRGLARHPGTIALAGKGFEALARLAGAVDLQALVRKFKKELEKDRQFTAVLQKKLADEQFIKNAPPELIAGERAKLAEVLQKTEKLTAYIRDMA